MHLDIKCLYKYILHNYGYLAINLIFNTKKFLEIDFRGNWNFQYNSIIN